MPLRQKFEALQLLQGGQAFFPALIKAFDAAAKWVQLETYIFDFHGAGAEVAEALVRVLILPWPRPGRWPSMPPTPWRCSGGAFRRATAHGRGI